MNGNLNAVVFDFGGVLIDWNPRYMYREVFQDPNEMEWFLQNVCTLEWNRLQDEGHPFSETVPKLQQQFPAYHDMIGLYQSRWPQMVGGEISDTIKILRDIQSTGIPVYGLTNWGAETFPVVYKRFEFLRKLDGIVVSGDEKLVKPDPKIYEILIDRYELEPEKTVFIDDTLQNIQSADEIGFKTIHFVSPDDLRKNLLEMKVL